ncbi:MAG: hypothetical protein JW811_08160 [Clostridiales bacterium]|nr:hypothetical protein [Clostridiales bacterium]
MKIFKNDDLSACVATGWYMGLLAGIGGFIHGLGAALQGSTSTNGLWIKTWSSGPIFEYLDGSPALTIVPNFLITGILAMLAALLLMYVTIACAKKKYGGLYIVSASAIMLLTGGGIISPIVGILAGSCVMGYQEVTTGKPLGTWEKLLASLWPYLSAVTVIIVAFTAVVPMIFAGFAAPYYTKSSTLTYAVPILLMIALNFLSRFHDAKIVIDKNVGDQ